MKGKNLFIISFLLFVIGNCQSTQIVDNTFLNPQRFYKISLPEKSWEIIDIDKEDIAMRNKVNNAMFAIISNPVNTTEYTLDTLYRQLFIGIKKKNVIDKQYVSINNRRVLHVILEGELDDFKVKISAYLIHANKMVYDIVYWSESESFDECSEDFERVVKSFSVSNN